MKYWVHENFRNFCNIINHKIEKDSETEKMSSTEVYVSKKF